MLADALAQNPDAAGRFRFSAEGDYRMALLTAECERPDAAVVEFPESGPWTPERCLDLCRTLRRHLPELPLLLLCPESRPDACELAVRAVKDGVVRDYVFYDASVQYLLSKLDTL